MSTFRKVYVADIMQHVGSIRQYHEPETTELQDKL